MRERGAAVVGTEGVFRAVLKLYDRDGRVTVRDLMDECGLSSPSTVHYHLQSLARAGLVAGIGSGRAGVIRPVVRPTRFVPLLSIEAR